MAVPARAPRWVLLAGLAAALLYFLRKDYLTPLPLAPAASAPCPGGVPTWDYPRQDLLGGEWRIYMYDQQRTQMPQRVRQFIDDAVEHAPALFPGNPWTGST